VQPADHLNQFVDEVRFGKVDIAMIPALRPALIPDSREARAHRRGDLLTDFLDKVAIPFSTLVLKGLDAYFSGANFEVLELLERVVISVISHSLFAQGDFPIVQGRFLDEEAYKFQDWAKDLPNLQTHLNMDEILVQGLKGERKAWRFSLIFIKLAAVKEGEEIDSNANNMLAAVRNSSGLRKECPYHYHMREALSATMITSVSPERGFSWLKRFLNRLSAGMKATLLDDCMQVAMNAPPDGKDSAWCNEVVDEFCS
jgi:hypothetical protein